MKLAAFAPCTQHPAASSPWSTRKAMPDVLRAGVGVASGVDGTALSGLGRRRFGRLPIDRRATLAGRVAEANLPIAAEFARLTRGLGLVAVYEQRYREGRA